MKHPWPFTRSQELALVQKALAGDTDARNELYLGYHDRIIAAHDHSGIGMYPAKFNNTFNAKGESYESHSGRIFDDVYANALKTFDILKASKGNHPFFTHLQSEIGYRALDVVENNKKESEETLTSSSAVEIGRYNGGKVSSFNYEGGCKRNTAYLDEEHIYDGDAVERRQRKIRNLTRQSLAKLKGTRAGITCKTYLQEAENGKPVVLDLAEKLGMKSGSVYYDFNAAKSALSSDEQDLIQDLLHQAA